MKIVQKTYYSTKDLEHDSRKMERQGWHAYLIEPKQERPGKVLFPLLGLLAFRKVTVYHVTWRK